MTGHNDSQLMDQGKHLLGSTLTHRAWTPAHADEDHDHCTLCWAKFSNLGAPRELKSGFCTSDGQHWVCRECVDHFKARFRWLLVDAMDVRAS